VSTAGIDQEPTREHHVAAIHWRPQGQFGRPLVGPDGGVLSLGGCQVGPQGGSRFPRGLEVVWMHRWAIGSM
jgi:hypothetical protein